MSASTLRLHFFIILGLLTISSSVNGAQQTSKPPKKRGGNKSAESKTAGTANKKTKQRTEVTEENTKTAELFGKYAKYKNARDWFPKGEPLPEYGICTAGATFVITSQDQLYDHIHELDCIWAVAPEPLAVPTGDMPGHIITLANTVVWATYGENSFRGSYVWETQCGGDPRYYGYDGVSSLRLPITYARWTKVDSFPASSVSTGEVVDNRGVLLADYSIDVTKECPIEGDLIPAAQPPTLFLPALSGLKLEGAPSSAFRALLRPIGWDVHGNVIMLGRTFMVNAFEPLDSWLTVAFFTVTVSDKVVITEKQLPKGQPIGPVPYTFHWTHSVSTEAVAERLSALAIVSAGRVGIVGINEKGILNIQQGGFGSAVESAANVASAAYRRFGLTLGDFGDTSKSYVDTRYSDPVDDPNEPQGGNVFPTRGGRLRPTKDQFGGRRSYPNPNELPFHVYMGRDANQDHPDTPQHQQQPPQHQQQPPQHQQQPPQHQQQPPPQYPPPQQHLQTSHPKQPRPSTTEAPTPMYIERKDYTTPQSSYPGDITIDPDSIVNNFLNSLFE